MNRWTLLILVSLTAVMLLQTVGASDEGQLLALHRAVLDAHLDADVEALLADESDDYVLANRGEGAWLRTGNVSNFRP